MQCGAVVRWCCGAVIQRCSGAVLRRGAVGSQYIGVESYNASMDSISRL